MVVADLMAVEGGWWNEDILSTVLLHFECERVKNIRLSSFKPADSWFWKEERDGIYTVRSAYRRLAGGREVLEIGGASNWEREKWLWNRLWKVPVWPRVKLFFLATMQRGLSNKSEYRFSSPSLHLFRDCVFAEKVWEGIGLGEEGREGGGVMDWVEARWRELGYREHALFMVGCWVIWEHRNKVVFDTREVDVACVIRRVKDVMDEMELGGFTRDRHGGGRSGSEGDEGRRAWVAPQPEYVKVNVDAGTTKGEE
ncbi:uncharacterized protein LOC141590232 [Silene latifolia]|uniref:uncharacterized protein LOC141590232 n=1 Tax=Silene latifolia TaxID=37657 RepID=UPI003D787EC2